MEQRDLIKQEVERLGQVFGKLIARLLGTTMPDEIHHIQTDLKSEVGLDIDHLLTLDRPATVDYLNEHRCPPSTLTLLAEYLTVTARQLEGDVKLAQRYADKAEQIIDIRDEQTGEISLDRLLG